MHTIKCGHCPGKHSTPREVFFCARGQANQRYATSAMQSQPATQPWPLSVPRAMVEQLREGRYAVQPDSNTPLTFVRIARPTYGKKKGCLLLQTQHSDDYKNCVIISNTGYVHVYDRRIEPSLLLVLVDPVKAAIRYGRELGRCSRCYKTLTDERSRYYGIGPECEKHWPDLINFVNETSGEYYVGIGS